MDPARRSSWWIPAALLAIGAVLSWWLQGARPGDRSGDGSADRAPASAQLPQRVVLFGPNLNEMAAVLGYAGRLVAITDYCAWPPEILHLPRIGGQLDPDLEALAVLRPDLLVLQGESPMLRSFATAQGLRVADVKMDDAIATILAGAEQLDLLFGGDGARGRAVADSLRTELEAIDRERPDRGGDRPRVLLVVARDPDGLGNLLTAGAGTFLDELIDIAGGSSWARPLGQGYYTVALEVLASDPPDLVVELSAGEPSADRARLVEPWQRLLRPTPAIERIEFEGVMVPGPRIVETARLLRDCIERGVRP